jgi:hypothetical protein
VAGLSPGTIDCGRSVRDHGSTKLRRPFASPAHPCCTTSFKTSRKIHSGIRPQTAKPADRFIAASGPKLQNQQKIHSGIRPQTAKPAEDPQRYQAPNCKTSRRSTAVSGPKLQNQQKIHSGIRPQTAKPTERFIAVSGPKLQNLQKSPLRHQARTSKPGPNAKNRRKTNNHNRKTSEGQVHPTARSRSSRPHKLQRNSTPAPHQSTSLAPFWNNTVSTRPRPLSATGSVVP